MSELTKKSKNTPVGGTTWLIESFTRITTKMTGCNIYYQQSICLWKSWKTVMLVW